MSPLEIGVLKGNIQVNIVHFTSEGMPSKASFTDNVGSRGRYAGLAKYMVDST